MLTPYGPFFWDEDRLMHRGAGDPELPANRAADSDEGDASSGDSDDAPESSAAFETFDGVNPRIHAVPFGVARPLKMVERAYRAIIDHLGSVEPEAGGMLLGPRGTSIVTHYIPDLRGKATGASFTLDAKGLNQVLKNHLECGLDAKGLVHSHPSGIPRPSFGDLEYVARSFVNPKNRNVTEFFLPIFCDGQMFPYVVLAAQPGVVIPAQLWLF